MKHLILRIFIVLVVVAAGVAAAYVLQDADRRMTATRAAELAVSDHARAVTRTIVDIKASQQSYVAQGQGSDFWSARVSSLLAALDLQLEALEGSLSADSSRASLEAARAAVNGFRRIDAKAREYVQAGQYLMASDVIFSDGIEALAPAAARIDAALAQEIQSREEVYAQDRRLVVMVLGGFSGLVLLSLLLLLPVARRAQPAEVGQQDARPDSGEVQPAAPAPESLAQLDWSIDEPAWPDLAEAARLCSELGRLTDPRDLAPLLERASQLVDASGIVVWIGDRTGSALRPVLAHGYSEQMLARMGTIPREAPNAVAAAYRTGEVRTVSGDAGANGAIVAPLMAPAGCHGVLAAELRHGGEGKKAVRALVTILAAQLAGAVSVASASSSGASAAAQG
jgi:hypothetical protein